MKIKKAFMWYAPVILFSAWCFVSQAGAMMIKGAVVPKTQGVVSCTLEFLYVPANEDIGGMQFGIRSAKSFSLTDISASSPEQGAWSQISPVLVRKDPRISLSVINPAFLKSALADTTVMFQLKLEFAGNDVPQNWQSLFDSLNIEKLISTDGKEIKSTLNFGALAVSGKGFSNNAQCRYVLKARRIHELTFSLKNDSNVKARVIDAKGKVIRILTDSKMAAGIHTVGWDGRTVGRSIAASGIYFIQLETGSFTYNKKVSVVR
jgi:hypothetical protein